MVSILCRPSGTFGKSSPNRTQSSRMRKTIMNSSHDNLRAELDRVCREVKFLRRCILAVLAGGALFLCVSATSRNSLITNFKTVRASNIQLVDHRGAVRMRLGGDSPVINMIDANGVARLGLQVEPDGSTAIWFGAPGNQVPLDIGVEKIHNFGPRITLQD